MMKRQIALLILAFAVLMFSVQGGENPDLGKVAVEDVHSHMPILQECLGLGMPGDIIKGHISDDDDDNDDEDSPDAIEVLGISYKKAMR